MKRYLFLILFIFLTYGNSFEIDRFDPKASLVENFSTNCLQMTQSQQILKAYILVGLNSNFQNPKENLKRAIKAYDSRAKEIKEYFSKKLGNSNKDAKDAFERAYGLWKDSKVMLEKEPTKENSLKIKSNFLKMIEYLLQGTKPLATPDLELISLTGKLCRKPIEITNDYLMKLWGIEIPNYEVEIKKIMDNFHKNLKTLSQNPLNNDESLKLLKKIERDFRFFEVMYNSKSRFIPNLLSKKADDNFKVIRKIKQIYKSRAK